MTFQCFGWNIFIFWPNLRGQPHKCTYFSAKLACIAGIFLKKVSLMYEHSFPIPFPCNLNYFSLYFIHDSMKSSCKYLIPLKPSHVLKTDPQYFGLFSKFQGEISMQTAFFHKLSLRFLWHYYKFYQVPKCFEVIHMKANNGDNALGDFLDSSWILLAFATRIW